MTETAWWINILSPRSSITASCDATDLVTDVHWNPVQRSDVYSTNASTSEYAQKTSSIDGETCCRSQLTKHASPMTDADWNKVQRSNVPIAAYGGC